MSFLKPTKGKIITFIILVIISLLIFTLPVAMGTVQPRDIIYWIKQFLVPFRSSFGYLLFWGMLKIRQPMRFVTELIFQTVYLYIISCLIIYIFKRK